MERNRFASPGNLGTDQRGITGLETAIVLIAFVVVASVFAFAVLSTGLLSSEKSKETVLGGLGETSSTLSIRGDVIGDANSGKTALDTVKFTLTSAAQAADAVDLSLNESNSNHIPGSGPSLELHQWVGIRFVLLFLDHELDHRFRGLGGSGGAGGCDCRPV